MKKLQRFRLVDIVLLALLIALNVVLSRFLSIATPSAKIGFSFLPEAIAAVLYGPLGGMAVAGLGDLIGVVLFPIGAYFPGYTLTALMRGAILGFGLYRRHPFWRVLLTVVTSMVCCTLLLNSLWITIGGIWAGLLPGSFSAAAFWGVLISRLPQAGILCVVQTVALELLLNHAHLDVRLQSLLKNQRG